MTKAKNNTKRTGLEIAVIGMSGRFPGAGNIDEFWDNLVNGVESVSFFTDEDLEAEGIPSNTLRKSNYVKARGIIEKAEYFDESFFNYTPLEAEMMDAQIRIFHEISWEALESAGYDPETYDGLIGVYAGATPNFNWEGLTKYSGSAQRLGGMGVRTLSDKDFLSTLISYKLNLTGPSFTFYTACSTSLVAVDLASRGLLTAECDMALAGGVTISFPYKTGYFYEEGLLYSRDGRCRAFDAKASGTIFGNGAGVVVLKRLDEAIADRDYILAIIKGTAINNDGLSKVGYTAPSIEGQAAAIQATQQLAQVEPESISYIEAHGTGTILGDPIEIEGLKLAFNTDKKRYCAIGSVKTNVGHLDCAAGVAGFIKTVLALYHRKIPPSLHYEASNPKIDFENSPFFVNTELREWTDGKYPLRAGVNSFGIGGTNAHAILEEAPKRESSPGQESRRWKVLVFSAKTTAALDKITENFAEFLTRHPETNLADAAFTLQLGRRAWLHRRMVVCADVPDTIDILSSRDTDSQQIITHRVNVENSPVVFMFPGQGAQYVDMGKGLYETEPVFRETMDRCFEILKPLMGDDIKEILYPGERKAQGGERKANKRHALCAVRNAIDQTEIAQPVIFAIEYALAVLLMKWGIKPQAMVGHSIGEYVAACLSGVLSLEDALTLVALRGKLMQQMPGGSMLSVPIPEGQLKTRLKSNQTLSLAAVNGPSQCVVSGPHQAINDFAKQLKEEGYEARLLHTSHAFHSTMMDPILEPFEKKVTGLTLNQPKIPFISNVTGKWILPGEAMNPGYWSKHIRATVRFSDDLKELLKDQNSIFIEMGPGRVLSTLVKQHADKKPDHLVVNLIRHPQNNISDVYFLLNKIGQLWVWGKKIDWRAFHSSSEKRYRIPMPTYPFERQYYVIQENFLEKLAKTPGSKKTQRKKDISDWFYFPSWKRSQLPDNRGFDPMIQPYWLLFMDEYGLGEGLLNRLEEEGLDVISVKIGPGYKKVNSQVLTIDPQSPQDYESLLKELHSQNRVPQSIIHLWLFTEMENKLVELDLEKVEEVQNLGFYSLVYLVQAIGKMNLKNEFRITVVTNNMQDVMGETVLCPEKAIVLGPVRVIPNEYTNITCRSIDLNIHNPHPGSWQKRKGKIVDQLFAEVTINDNDSYNTIAYRNDIRWIQIPEPIHLEMPEEKITCLTERGVYLITGGLGGIGLVLAEHLVKTVNARLVLIGRTALPRRENWQQWLDTQDEENSVSQKIKHILALEEQGGEILVLSADVSNLEQMQGAIRGAIEKFGQINGVIHTAGIPDAGFIQRRNKETSGKVLLPKIRGSIILDKVLKNVELDFFIICSSVIAAVGNIGQVAYCAANNFLDAFSRYRTQRDDAYTVSIGWEGWKEVGMLANMVKKRTKPTSKKTVVSESKELDHFLFDEYIFNPPHQEIFVSKFRVDRFWFLHEHRIMRNVVMLGAAYLEMAAAAFESHVGDGLTEFRNVYFLSPMVLREDEERDVQLVMKKNGESFEFVVISRFNTENNWKAHARGELRRVPVEPRKQHDLKEIQAKCNEEELIIKKEENRPFGKGLMQVSQRWNTIRQVNLGKNQALGRFELPGEYAEDLKVFKIHPALLDYATSFFGIFGKHKQGGFLPFSYKRMKVYAPFPRNLYSYAIYTEDGDPMLTRKYNIIIMDEQARQIAEIEEYSLLTVTDRGRPLVEKIKKQYPISSVFPGDSYDAVSVNNEAKKIERYEEQISILSSEGINVFTRILGSHLPHMVISTVDLADRIETARNVLRKDRLEKSPDRKKENSGPKRIRPNQQIAYAAPTNDIEQKLTEILQEYLGIDKIGIRDDFFEIGGDSLKAINISTRIKSEFNVEIQFADIFVMPTVQGLAGHIARSIDRGEVTGHKTIKPVEKKEYYPLSPAQQQMFVLQQMDKGSAGYNELVKSSLPHEISKKKMEKIILQLMQRQESLRTSFELVNGLPVQKVHEEVKPKIEFYEGAENYEELMAQFLQPFDLAKPPLFKIMIIKIAEDDYRFFFVIHHIIVDKITGEILGRDTNNAVLNREPKPLKIQYKDYAEWMNTPTVRQAIEKQETFWLKEFEGEIPLLNLPYDFQRTPRKSLEGDSVPFEIEMREIQQLKEMVKTESATLNMVLLSIYYILLAKLSGQEDIIIGNLISLRNQPELFDVVGIFLNTLAIRNFPKKEKTFKEFLSEVKEKFIAVFKNKDYLFENLVKKLSLSRDTGRHPLFDTVFYLETMDSHTFKSRGEKFMPDKPQNSISEFDLTLLVAEVNEELKFAFEYSTKLFTRIKVERFAGYFKEALASVLENKDIKLKDIKLSHEILAAEQKIPKSDFVFQ